MEAWFLKLSRDHHRRRDPGSEPTWVYEYSPAPLMLFFARRAWAARPVIRNATGWSRIRGDCGF